MRVANNELHGCVDKATTSDDASSSPTPQIVPMSGALTSQSFRYS